MGYTSLGYTPLHDEEFSLWGVGGIESLVCALHLF
jgi:hypothetical protein